jgi:hypothetical protein
MSVFDVLKIPIVCSYFEEGAVHPIPTPLPPLIGGLILIQTRIYLSSIIS